MRRRIHRREFLSLSLQAAAAAHFIPIEQLQAAPRDGHSPGLLAQRRKNLRAAIDEIVPAEGRMPAVSAVGGVQYIERLCAAYSEIGKTIAWGLDLLEERSRKVSGNSFALSAAEQRVQMLRTVETEDDTRRFFALFRNIVYEAYYTSPRVWRLIGYKFRNSRRRTAPLEPFDEKMLARVLKMGRLYREVD